MPKNLLAANVKISPQNPWSHKIESKIVEEKNGHKYGIIGASPIDLYKRNANFQYKAQCPCGHT